MEKASERRLRAMMRKADARKKSSLLVNNLVETAVSGTPLLTESEEDDILRSFKTDDERQEYITMHRAACYLTFCVGEAQVKYREVITMLTSLGGHFRMARVYRCFENLLNELCWKRSGGSNERLQERAVSTGRIERCFRNISLKEESGGGKSISLQMADKDLAYVSEVIESLEQKASELKAMTQFIRDAMKQYTGPINCIVDAIDDLEKNAREGIRLTKRLLYVADFEGWDELRTILLQQADPLLTMMEAVAEYDDIVFDGVLYDDTVRSLNREIAGARGWQEVTLTSS
jgi:hypothetical protein